jgi:hypothetical protein
MGVSGTTVASVVFTAGALGVGVYALVVYGVLTQWAVTLGATVHPNMRVTFKQEMWAIYPHALLSALALIIGPFQVIPQLREGHWLAHRRAGYLYVVCAVLGSVTGVVVAQRSQGGAWGHAGFTILGLLWLVSTIAGVVAIVWWSDPALHEVCMQVSCALAYSAVTIRVLLPIAVASGSGFQTIYGAIAWLCWIINLVVLGGLRWRQWVGHKPIPPGAAGAALVGAGAGAAGLDGGANDL